MMKRTKFLTFPIWETEALNEAVEELQRQEYTVKYSTHVTNNKEKNHAITEVFVHLEKEDRSGGYVIYEKGGKVLDTADNVTYEEFAEELSYRKANSEGLIYGVYSNNLLWQ